MNVAAAEECIPLSLFDSKVKPSQMARGLKIAKKLVAIDLADNRITEEPDVLEAFVQLFKENKVLGKSRRVL